MAAPATESAVVSAQGSAFRRRVEMQGAHFEEVIDDAIAGVTVVLVVIGPG